jgi:hypothetical protein
VSKPRSTCSMCRCCSASTPDTDSSSSAPPSCTPSRPGARGGPTGLRWPCGPAARWPGARRSAARAGRAIVSGSSASTVAQAGRARSGIGSATGSSGGRSSQLATAGRAHQAISNAPPALISQRHEGFHRPQLQQVDPVGAEAAPQRGLALALQHVRGLQVHRVERRQHQQQRAGGADRAEHLPAQLVARAVERQLLSVTPRKNAGSRPTRQAGGSSG